MERKEAIEVIKKNWFDNSNSMLREALETLIPELKESKSEEIKKELLSFLKEGKPYYCPNSTKRQEWAAWLEKQGENTLFNEEMIEALRTEYEKGRADAIVEMTRLD